MSTFTAKYASGTCTECESPIKAGEEIIRSSDQGYYVHVDCPDNELDLVAKRPACPSCFIIGPCDCND